LKERSVLEADVAALTAEARSVQPEVATFEEVKALVETACIA
jgi:hypothetical protein